MTKKKEIHNKYLISFLRSIVVHNFMILNQLALMSPSTHKFVPTPYCFLFVVWNYRLWRWGGLQWRHLQIDQLIQNLKWGTHGHTHVACWSHKLVSLSLEKESRLKAYWKNKLCSNWTINIHKGSFISSFIQFLIKNGSVHRRGWGGLRKLQL